MSQRKGRKLSPRNKHTLKTGVVCRISGCKKQKEVSLQDQLDNAKTEVDDHYQGHVDYKVIATVGKGEHLDRPELDEIEAAYRSKEYDLFVYDDLGRLIRGGEAVRLLAIGVDCGTRSICINDCIDTNDPSWEVDALNACADNVAHVEMASKRIKQKMMKRFTRSGKTAARPIAGYVVPKGSESFDEWQKAPGAELHILEGARILRLTRNAEGVADYFNRVGFPTGEMTHVDKWNGTMVLRFYRNTLLKGKAMRGKMVTVKQHSSGRRRSQCNPDGPTYYDAPHLAYFDEASFDELVDMIADSNSKYCRKLVDGVDRLTEVPRDVHRFPSHLASCWYCGRPYIWSGTAEVGHLMCTGSHNYCCWNAIHIDGEMVLRRVRESITSVLYQLEGFDAQFQHLVAAAHCNYSGNSGNELKRIASELVNLAKEKRNLLDAIKLFGPKEMYLTESNAIETREHGLLRQQYLIQQKRDQPLQLPNSVTELRSQLESQFQILCETSHEFSAVMQQLVPEFHVYLVRQIDGGHPSPRARLKLAFNGIAPDVAKVPELDALLTRTVTVDLFDPPQRERIRLESVRLEASGHQQREIANLLAERPKQAAVHRALALHRSMLSRGMSSPYELLKMPPDDYHKLRRHRNRRYSFQTLKGYSASAVD